MGVKNRLTLAMFLALLTGVLFVGWVSGSLGLTRATAQESKVGTKVQRKKLSHEETLRWVTEHKAWRRARKTKPIWARAVEAEEVGKEFQTADHAVEKARAGYWLCVGVAGEPWFQTLEKIEGKYEPAGEEVKTFEFDGKPRKYRIFKPKATTRNWVAQVKGPGIAGFFIRPNYDPAASALFTGGWLRGPRRRQGPVPGEAPATSGSCSKGCSRARTELTP